MSRGFKIITMKNYYAATIAILFVLLNSCKNETTFQDVLGNYDGKIVLVEGFPERGFRLRLNQDSTFQLLLEDGKIYEEGKFKFYNLKFNDTIKQFGEIVSSEQKSLQIIEFITVFDISPELYNTFKGLGDPSTNRRPGDLIYSYLIYDESSKSLFVYPRTALEKRYNAQGKLPFYLLSTDEIVFKKE